jgi:hypothetical protein
VNAATQVTGVTVGRVASYVSKQGEGIVDGDRKAFVDRVREENERGFGPPARQALRLLDAALPHPWTYVYELTQNARDAGAQHVSWRTDHGTVMFEHDGPEALQEEHVRALSSLGGSTKGLASVGFMGVGFKAVFSRFRTARIAGSGWHFRFDVDDERGTLGVTIPNWLDTLRPRWDGEILFPSAGYTTLFRLENLVHAERGVAEDLAHLASIEDPTPLAVLALRGIEEIRIDEAVWLLSVVNDVVDVLPPGGDLLRWKAFRARYRPDDAAMRRFLEVRRTLEDHVDDTGQRIERDVIGLVPLAQNGLPRPPDRGRVYATLPTQVRVPFGLDLQADWLVNVDRQNLRDVEGDPWQEAIVRQVPRLVREYLTWLAGESDACRRQGYGVLCDPTADDDLLARPFQMLRDAMIAELSDRAIVPIHSSDGQRFAVPKKVFRLPGRFATLFGSRPSWRVDLLCQQLIMDEAALGKRAAGFASWLGWGRALELNDTQWPASLPGWWGALPDTERVDALLALWECVQHQGWDVAPVVPTEAGEWVPARRTHWLNEEPPTDNEPSGTIIAQALADVLPDPPRRLPPAIRQRVNRASGGGVEWLKRHHVEVTLASLIQRLCRTDADATKLPLVELLEWALSRGDRRDLVPLVLTEKGPRAPERALLADPLVEGGANRRLLFPGLAAVVADYGAISETHAVVMFLERLGVKGRGYLVEEQTHIWSAQQVAEILGISREAVRSANRDGYRVKDLKLPFDPATVDAGALNDWLAREHTALREKGRRWAESSYYGHQRTAGAAPCQWVRSLRDHPWILCRDGQRRKPAEVLLEPSPDYEEAPIADIDAGLAQRLLQEGVRFGAAVPRSPAIRRLVSKASSNLTDAELAELIAEAREQMMAGRASQEEFERALLLVRLRGRFSLDRLVERTGAGAGLRSDLGEWVLPVSEIAPVLASRIREVWALPLTTTGLQALGFLAAVWAKPPDRVEEVRRHLAVAYRYVVDDMERDATVATAWNETRSRARLYGRGRWHALGPTLVVEDVQSPVLHRLLSRDRMRVTPSHLGESSEQIRRVAGHLGVRLLSAEITLDEGASIVDPPYAPGVRELVNLLAKLPDRKPLQRVVFRTRLALRVGPDRHEIFAYITDGNLLLAGDPASFGTEAAGQIVEYFQLSQQGGVVPYLTAAILSVDYPEQFRQQLAVLVDSLDLPPASVTPIDGLHGQAGTAGKDTAGEPEAGQRAAEHVVTSKSGGEVRRPGAATSAEGGSRREHESGWREDGRAPATSPGPRYGSEADGRAPRDGAVHVDSSAGGSHASSASRRAGSGADLFGILVTRSAAGESEAGVSNLGGVRDDDDARRAVLEYEKQRGRQAHPMSHSHAGYDIVSSVDITTGKRRWIEVKGVGARFEGDASVVLSARQVHDALRNTDDSVEYWLYVVDGTGSDRRRVFPIPWACDEGRLRYGFYARVWGAAAELPAVVTADGLEELTLAAMGPLDPGDLGDDWNPPDGVTTE